MQQKVQYVAVQDDDEEEDNEGGEVDEENEDYDEYEKEALAPGRRIQSLARGFAGIKAPLSIGFVALSHLPPGIEAGVLHTTTEGALNSLHILRQKSHTSSLTSAKLDTSRRPFSGPPCALGLDW